MAELFHILCTIQSVHGRLHSVPDVDYPILDNDQQYAVAFEVQVTCVFVVQSPPWKIVRSNPTQKTSPLLEGSIHKLWYCTLFVYLPITAKHKGKKKIMDH